MLVVWIWYDSDTEFSICMTKGRRQTWVAKREYHCFQGRIKFQAEMHGKLYQLIHQDFQNI